MEDKQFQQLIGQHLRKYRKDKSLTIETLAERMNISTNHLGRIERGENDTTLTIFIKMAAILDIPNDFIEEIKQLYKENQA
ncbi:helix-turn-helix transcriptional regulator [Virgibacillus necropolis]|uniref:helix-turn-helix domain-containing protein n=1 Tax=Virgibacillus necropolis TaxID=163877 RepID=UPI0038511640